MTETTAATKSAKGFTLRGLLAAALIFSALATFGLSYLSFKTLALQSFEHWTSDWRTALLADTSASQHERIAVVVIDDDAVAGQPYRSPIDRGLLANVIKAIDGAGPKAIGIDILVDQATEPEKDRAFLEAIRGAQSKVVLGGVDARTRLRPEQRAYHEQFLTSAGAANGYLNLRYEIDKVVRSEAEPAPGGRLPRSFAAEIAAASGGKAEGGAGRIAWLKAPADGSDTFLVVPAGDLVGAATGPVAQLRQRMLQQLKDRIVLIGGDLSDQTDRHPTPLAKTGDEAIPGVLIHAHLVAQYLDGRRYARLLEPAEVAIVFILAWTGFLLGWRYARSNFLTNTAPVLGLAVADAVLFWKWRMMVPAAAPLLAWVLGIFSGRCYRWIGRWI
jgi:adenylate cyclase